MAKLVLDTNCLIQSIPQRSRYHVLWQSFVDGKNKLCVSNEILEEYIEILQRLTDNETAEYVVKTILNSPFVELITPFYHFNLITVDPDDNKFVDCAISANAHYIVTNDHHYDVLKDIDFPKVNVVNIQQFFKTFITITSISTMKIPPSFRVSYLIKSAYSVTAIVFTNFVLPPCSQYVYA